MIPDIYSIISDNYHHQLLRSRVYDYLRYELKVGNLKAGMMINMNKIMEKLNIGRTPLRDALLQLQTERFLTFLPQRGIKINELSKKDFEDIYEMLGGLDSRAFLTVFDKIGSKEIKQMKKINKEMIAVLSDTNFSRYWDLNTAFHNIYLHHSTNRPLLNQINIMRQQLFEFRQKEWGQKMRELNYREHFKIIDLIEKGEAIKAADFLRSVHFVINY